ncbi:hypothetical protein K3495_g5554 [Podosphaera aphanis]|nr:hypothetical protein K3495_g5554 [Podosphaera aphanis]
MMLTLHQIAKVKEAPSGGGQIAFGKEKGRGNGQANDVVTSAGPEALCIHCYHNKHKNKNYFRQHPELRKKYKENGSAKVVSDLKDEVGEDEDSNGNLDIGTIARAGAGLKPRLLFDTVASHHFVRCKDNFLEIRKLAKPFEFDQAVGNSMLKHMGTCRLRIGNLSLDLKKIMYSPSSACDIVSAVKLMRDHGIVAARRNEILAQINYEGHDIPEAKLRWAENLTPHPTFDEDIVLGDMLCPREQRKSSQYWTSGSNLPRDTTAPVRIPVPPQADQTSQFEGENLARASAPQGPEIRQNYPPEPASEKPDVPLIQNKP